LLAQKLNVEVLVNRQFMGEFLSADAPCFALPMVEERKCRPRREFISSGSEGAARDRPKIAAIRDRIDVVGVARYIRMYIDGYAKNLIRLWWQHMSQSNGPSAR
jgi:hypothetical protein